MLNPCSNLAVLAAASVGSKQMGRADRLAPKQVSVISIFWKLGILVTILNDKPTAKPILG
jgi:hypothetical protein